METSVRRASDVLCAVVGPTASGKSDLALELACVLPGALGASGAGEIVSADALQLYRGMDVGTAKTPMEELDERIAVRTRAMMDGGLIEEVRALIDVGLREAKTASRATGYAQALAVIDGQMSEDEAVESIALATRQLARRQVKWLRPDPRVHWLDVESFDSNEAVARHVVELTQREAEASLRRS